MTDYYHCSPLDHCDICEDEIMEEKAKVYIPLPDNVRPKSLIRQSNALHNRQVLEEIDGEEARNFMGMNEVEFETFMNQLLENSSGLAND